MQSQGPLQVGEEAGEEMRSQRDLRREAAALEDGGRSQESRDVSGL